MSESPEKGPKRQGPKIEASADYYTRLGVSSNASQADITAAFRKLSKELHPDSAGPGSEEKMKLVSEAYATLKDPEKRARYSPPRARPFEEGRRSTRPDMNDFEDMFGDIFGEKPERGGARSYTGGFDDIFKRAEARRAKADSRKRGEAHAGREDFSQSTHQSSERNADRRTDPEILVEEALHEVKAGAFFFRMFVDRSKREGVPNIDTLITNKKVVAAILEESVISARLGSYFYDSNISKWVQEMSFDRVQADTNPALMEVIQAEALSRAGSTHSLNSYLLDWQRRNPSFDRRKILENQEFIDFLKNAAQNQKNLGNYFYKKFLEDWQKIGVDISKIQ